MPHKKICVTSPLPVGCTFIDWSIHFLSGQTEFFNADNNQWGALTANPLSQDNAHNHKKNHPAGCLSTNRTLDLFDQQKSGVFTFYPQPLRFNETVKILDLTVDKNHSDPEINGQILQCQHQDFADLFELCAQRSKIVYVDSSPEIDLYHTNYRRWGTFLFEPGSGPQSELADEFEQYYFGHAIAAYKDLTDRWDIRERKALNIRPFDANRVALDLSLPHLWIDSRSFWTLGETYMQKILQYVDLELDNQRLDLWRPIYTKWQHTQFVHLDFCHVLPHIVESIVNGWDYQLNDLTFEQEIVIQHCLIYQYDLNLKTWQLDKFPDNTKKLHQLLEPNIHKVDTIY